MANLNHAEFAKKYTSTFALVTCKSLKLDRVGVYFTDIYPDEESSQYICIMEAGKDRYKAHLTEIKVEETPNRQMFDLNGRSMEFCRVPERQWQKGLGRSNCVIHDPILNIVAINQPEGASTFEVPFIMYDYPSRGVPMTTEIVEKLFETYEQRSLSQAIAYLDHTKALSVCLDKKYALCIHPTQENKYLILRYTVPIGITDINGKYTVLLPIFKQEMEDLHVKYFN